MSGALRIPQAGEASSFADRVASALAERRPAMEPDGGGVDLVEVRAGVVTMRVVGSCVSCPSRPLSSGALERRLRERVPEVSGVRVMYPAPRTGRSS